MRRRILALLTAIGLAAAVISSSGKAAEITVFTVRAGKTVLEQIAPDFERVTGNKLHIVFTYGPELVAKISAGEPFDVLITGAPGIDAQVVNGKLIPDTRTDLFRSGMGVLVRPGAAQPDIGSAEGL